MHLLVSFFVPVRKETKTGAGGAIGLFFLKGSEVKL